MTKIQIEYFRNKELERSNRAQERETERSNKARESEQHRSNTAQENLTAQRNANDFYLGSKNYYETVRSNKAREQLNSKSIDETVRSNRARESEQRRSSLARESEDRRSHLANESISRQKVGVDSRNATTNRMNAITNAYTATTRAINDAKSIDLGLRNLQEQARSNRQKELETHRSNMANEVIRAQSNAIEQQRADTAALQVSNQVRAQGETIRHNQATEALGHESNVFGLISGLTRVLVR